FCSAFYRDIRSYRFLMNECRVNQVLHKPVDEERFLEVLEKLFGAEGRETLPPEPEERAELRGSYVASAIERVESMRRTLQVLAEQDAPDLVSALRLEAHRFRGSGASFDLPEVSRLGGAIEDLLTSRPKEGGLPGAFRSRLEGLLDALESARRREAGQSPIAELRGFSPRPRILLVDDPESALARRSGWWGGGRPCARSSNCKPTPSSWPPMAKTASTARSRSAPPSAWSPAPRSS